MKSDGSQQRAYCYVSDCVSAMLYVLFYGQNAEAYNITNEYCFISIKELAELMAKAYNKNVIYSMPGREEQQGYSILRYTRLCNKKIKSLGWNAKVGMEDGIKRTIKILLEGSYGI
jgi:nucleoside-diphosphate-sugar epimerase